MNIDIRNTCCNNNLVVTIFREVNIENYIIMLFNNTLYYVL